MLEHAKLKNRFLFVSAMIVAGSILAGTWGSNVSARQAGIVLEKVQFVNHLAAGMIEQDVFVERTANSESVFRLTKDEKGKYLSSPLLSSPAPHQYTTRRLKPMPWVLSPRASALV